MPFILTAQEFAEIKPHSSNEPFEDKNIQDASEHTEIPVITAITIHGLKRTKNSYIQSRIKQFIGTEATEETIHSLETNLKLEGLFNTIEIELSGQSPKETSVEVTVEEKISFLPLPIAMYTSSGFSGGFFLLDTNTFGMKDSFIAGGFFSKTNSAGTASFIKPPKSNGIPGFSVSAFVSKNSTEIRSTDNDTFFEYKGILFNGNIKITEQIGKNNSVAAGISFKNVHISDKDDFPLEIDSTKILSGKIETEFRKSDWNGWFMSSVVLAAQAEIGISDSDNDNLKYPRRIAGRISFAKPLFFPNVRLYGRNSFSYGTKLHLSNYSRKDDASVSILPYDFISQHVAGGHTGLELGVIKGKLGTISLFADYQYAYVHNFNNEYEFMHGPNGGVKVYLEKVTFPALSVGFSYNVTKQYLQVAAAMGVSF